LSTYTAAKTASTQTSIRSALFASMAAKGSPLAGFSARAPQRVIADDVSARIAEESAIRAALARAVDPRELLDLDDDWTDAFLARFGTERIPALPAVWTCYGTSTVAPTSVGPGDLLVQSSSTGAPVFEVASGAPRWTLPHSLTLTCRTAGTVGNTITSPAVVLGPAGLILSMFSLVTAGRAAETNAEAITRALARWARLGAGWTLQAFDSLVPEAAPSLTRWRARDDAPRGEGTVLVVLGNSLGAATSTEVGLVQARLGSRSVKPLGSGLFVAEAAAVDALAIAITIEGDGTNASLAADAEAAVLALCDAFPMGRATLDDGLVRAVALGGSFRSVSVDTGDGQAVITPSLPGFAGAKSIAACSLASPHGVPTDGVLVASVAVTVV